MAYAVFEAPTAAVDALEKDDVTSRQSIVVRDGAKWGVAGRVAFVQGTDEGVRRAEEIVTQHGGRRSTKEADIKQGIEAESDEAAGGMGFVFG